MKRPQSAKPGFKGYWGQASSDQIADQSLSGKHQHRQNIKIMKPDLTTHDFARILPKKIHQDKERLYSQALQLKQTVNELMQENVRLKTKISILEKEKDKMNRYMDSTAEGLSRQGNSRLNIYGSKSTEKDNLIVRNLKKIVRQSRQQCEYLKGENQKIKKTVKYTKINELQIEKKMILDENKKIATLLEEYNSQIISQQEMQKENDELKRYLEEEIQQNKTLGEENQKYEEIVQTLEEKIKVETDKFHAKEKKLQRDLALEKRKTSQQHRYIEDLRKELKTLQAAQAQQVNMKKKPAKPMIRPASSHPGNYQSNLSSRAQPKENTLNVQPSQEIQTSQIKKKNELLEKQLKDIKIRLQKSENQLSRNKVHQSERKENIQFQKSSPQKGEVPDPQKDIVSDPPKTVVPEKNVEKNVQKKDEEVKDEKREPKVAEAPKTRAEPVKLQQKYQFDDTPEKEQESYNNAFEPEPQEDKEYEQQFQKSEGNKAALSPKKTKEDMQIQKMKKDFEQNDEEQELYKKEEGEAKKKKGQKKKKEKVSKEKGFKPDKKILAEIKELLTFRMKAQRYPFEDLEADIKSAQSSTFTYSDLCNMLVNEPFYLTSNYTKSFLSYCYQKQHIPQNQILTNTVLITKLRKCIADFTLMEENQEKEMILRIAEMTSTYPYELQTAFENIKNGEDTVAKKELISMFQKLELEDKYIDLIIAQLSLCSDDLEHLNFHGFFERFYIEEEGPEGIPHPIQEQGEESEESYKNTSRIKKKGKNTRKASEEEEDDGKIGHYMLAPEQPIENKNYEYDQDIVSDDGRI